MYLMITLGTLSYALRISDSLTGNCCDLMRKKQEKLNVSLGNIRMIVSGWIDYKKKILFIKTMLNTFLLRLDNYFRVKKK